MRNYYKAFVVICFGALLTLLAHYIALAVNQEHSIADLSTETSFASVPAALDGLKLAIDREHLSSPANTTEVRAAIKTLADRWAAFSSGPITRVTSDPAGIVAAIAFDQDFDTLRRSLSSGEGAQQPDPDIAETIDELERLSSTILAIASSDFDDDLIAKETALRRSGIVLSSICATMAAGALVLIVVLFRHVGRLRRVSRHDMLTGLQNRLTFSETLARQINDPGPGNEVGLMLLDLDLFKVINDSLGHTAGDDLLKGIARRLQRLPAAGLTLARLGGDEFAIIIAARSAHRNAINIAGLIADFMEEPFAIEGKSVRVAMSIGIASTPAGWCSAQDLLKFADVALYEAKSAGRGTFKIYNSKMIRKSLDRQELEADLRQAITSRQLDLHFQPIIELTSKDIVGFEALARWNHPRRGFIPPSHFIPMAEDIGLIKQIGNWVLEEACRTAMAWPKHVRVLINLSAHQFDGHDLPAALVNVLSRTEILPSRVELEITESVLLRDNAHTLRILSDLKALGVRIALDDFGTGYSSLAYLQRFPIDKIKIDQSFVRQAASRPQSAAIIEAITLLAQKLGVSTTAEGIETAQDADLVRALGCNEGQGYFFDRPLTKDLCLIKLNAAQSGGPAAAAA